MKRARLWMICAAACLALVGCSPVLSDPEVPPATAMGADTLLWGPEIKAQALRMIAGSTVFCHLTMYELGDPDILSALAAAAKRGVDVEAVLDATEPHTLATAYPFLRGRRIKVRLLKVPGGISHIKSLVTMDGAGMHALLGGMNFGEYSWLDEKGDE